MQSNFIACGVDEVGKGAIAGPVVVASVAFHNYEKIPCKIQDSKKVSSNNRLKLFNQIKQVAWTGIGIVSPEIIDKIGIIRATNLAAKKSIPKNFKVKKLLIDGYIKISAQNKIENIIKGDENYVSIAAASIIAKVTRDNIMIEKGKNHPEYKWFKNMGYGTKEHLLAIKKYGITDFHRKTFKIKLS